MRWSTNMSESAKNTEPISSTKVCYNLDSSGVKPHGYVYRYLEFCSRIGEYLDQAKTPNFYKFRHFISLQLYVHEISLKDYAEKREIWMQKVRYSGIELLIVINWSRKRKSKLDSKHS
jgi:hypothetical protein